MQASARYLPLGDSAITVEFGDAISVEINRKVLALDEAITKARIQGIEETAPAYRSVLIRYDPMKMTFEQVVLRIKELEETIGKPRREVSGKVITIPVVYGGKYGPDLDYVAQNHGLTEKQVVKLHSCRNYRVYMLGFVAGFPYLGEVVDAIATPRLETPRLKVPAGSVGIAEKQTGIYPCEAPGGWRIIGRTPLKLFNPKQEPPTLLKPGDTVRFKPVSENEFKFLSEEP